MIRIISRVLLAVCTLGLFGVAVPVLAADIFLKKDTAKQEGPAKGGYFVPLQKLKEGVFNWNRKETTKAEPEVASGKFDVRLLGFVGPGPQTQADLMQIAQIQNEPVMNELKIMQASHAKSQGLLAERLERTRLENAKKVDRSPRKKGKHINVFEQSKPEDMTASKPKVKTFTKKKKTNPASKKPPKIFNDYREGGR